MKAYFDTGSDLVPCEVVKITNGVFTVKLTAKRGSYKKGFTAITTIDWVIPENKVSFHPYLHIKPYSIDDFKEV